MTARSTPPGGQRLPRLRPRRPHAVQALLDLTRLMFGVGETNAARRARLDRKTAVERQARRRL